MTALFLCLAAPVLAQGTNVTFGTITQDTTLPVEVTADNLSVDQSTGTAVFDGNVTIGQGEMRLTAARVLVTYRSQNAGIAKLEATGGVTLVTGDDAAEAERADYNIDTGEIEMTGNVLLTQGASALTAEKMFVDLRTGNARMSGRVKTILQTGSE
ncbi:lipopolysaccharide transport periplasmic protein LptA [Pseudosulfitobacter koreensis]|uniref:Lipopolysaccharide transport periplasmic protein LptA n=1 Tax=Pseudosulfitobacter koreensis TaxID=2968472 RepID=A0ABT1Z538_9RHOB|nr:lipopolysaccharide transport periplasmic protein LptA [Pseudosulfitobacter koreense]MCR8828259.1 lipopolysaccharide transport periplasmic protein LptA [Pseudosulfitobacter koreense]